MTEQMKFKMRFVGFKEDGSGELKPTSPGGFKRHEIRELPFEYSLSIWWEIVDAIPDLVIPEPRYEDSVFIEEVFVPDDAVDIAPPLGDEDENLFIVEPSLEPSEAFMVAPDALSDSDPVLVGTETPEKDYIEGFASYEPEIKPGKVVKIKGIGEKAPDEDEADEVIVSHSGELGKTLTVKVYPETELEGIPYEKMTVKSLKLLIEQLGGEVDSQWRKADLIREARKLEKSSSPT